MSQTARSKEHGLRRDRTNTYTKERSNKRRKLKQTQPKRTKARVKKKASSGATGTLVVKIPSVTEETRTYSWEHWIFQALQSPSLPLRQASLRLILKGSSWPTSRYKLREALVALVESHVLQSDSDATASPEAAIQLVGLLTHLISEEQPWKDPVLGETDLEITSFVAGGGLRWVTQSILTLVKSLLPLFESRKNGDSGERHHYVLQSHTLTQPSDSELEAVQLKLCLMIHLCYRLVMYSVVPSAPTKLPTTTSSSSNNNNTESSTTVTTNASTNSATKKQQRRRALSETSRTSDKSNLAAVPDEQKYKDLASERHATLQHLLNHFWSTGLASSNTNGITSSCLSPLACLVCAYEMLAIQDTVPSKSKRTRHCLSMLAKLIHPSATVTVVSFEEGGPYQKSKTSTNTTSASNSRNDGASRRPFPPPPPSSIRGSTFAAAAMAQAMSAAVEALGQDGGNSDAVMEDIVEEGGIEEDEVMEEEEEEGDGNHDEEDVNEDVEEENGDEEDVQSDEDHDEEHEDEFVDVQEGDDIVEEEEEDDDEIDSEDEEGDEDGEGGEEGADANATIDAVRQFEQRMLGIGTADLPQADGEEGLATLDGGRSHSASNVLPATGEVRSRALVKACLQVLAVQHQPTAVGVLHGPATRGVRPKTPQNKGIPPSPILSPPAEQSLIKRVCDVVKPPRKPLNLKVFMRRAPTQEEFFRGSLTRNPIPLSSLTQPGATSREPTVRDLRQHIANDLQMSDSAELIELLVANQILDLSLKLRVVQQVLWKAYLVDNSSLASASQQASSFFGSGMSIIFNSGSDEPFVGRNISADTPLSILPPMVVTYRLAGVDGEATEDQCTSLEDPEAPSSSTSAEEQERAMEKEYGMTQLVTEGRGISILLRSIESSIFDALRRIRRDDVARLSGRPEEKGRNPSREKFRHSPPCYSLTLLRHCTQLASNRKKLLEAQAPTFLLRLLLDVLNSLDEASARAAAGLARGEGTEGNPDEAHAVTNPTADLLQELIETLASDISPELETALASSADKLNEASSDAMGQDAEEAASTLPLLLSSLRTIYLGPPMRKVIAKLLPFLTYGQPTLSRELASNFVTHVNIDALGDMESATKPDSRASVLMDTFVQAAISMPPSGVCSSLRSELKNCGFAERLASFILKDVPQQPPPWSPALWTKGADFGGIKRDAIEKMWRSYFLRSGLRSAFQMLSGLCNSHEPTQSLIASFGSRKSAKGDASFLTACHWLEATSDNSSLSIQTKGVGILAETLLDELSSGNDRVSKKVKTLRKETRNRKQEIAQDMRNKTLVRMSSFGPMVGVDQNRSSVAAAENRGQSAVGLVGSVARRAASFLGGGGPATRSSRSPRKSDKSKPSWLEEMEALEDEAGLTCAICQEGRTLQPSELLGLYTFVKKVTIPFHKCGGRTHIDGSVLLVSLPRSLPDSLVNTTVDREWFRPARIAADSVKESTDIMTVLSSGPSSQSRRSTNLVTTVSAGNAIHCSCHAKARVADRNHSRAPKSEWEGASLRNSRVRCNAILPLVSSKSSSVSLVAVDVALTEHQQIVSNILGQKPKSNLWLVLHDVRLLLLRMAYGEALNDDCGGGSLSSNATLLFYQLFMADMFANVAEHNAPYMAQHARFLSAGFLAAANILRANDFDARSSAGTTLARGIADSSPMASICCILFNNSNSDEDMIEPEKAKTPHPRRRWVVQKEEFLRGLIACAGRRHALRVEDSGCVAASRSRSSQSRSSSFSEWDSASEGVPSRRKPTSILGKRGLPQIDDFANALRPMITLYAMFEQLSSDFVVGMDDEAVEGSSGRLADVVHVCRTSHDIRDLLQKAKVTLDHEEIIEYLQKGMESA